MKTNSGIEVPESLFKAIDRVHREATQIYKSISPQAMELISPTRGSQTNNTNGNKKNKPV